MFLCAIRRTTVRAVKLMVVTEVCLIRGASASSESEQARLDWRLEVGGWRLQIEGEGEIIFHFVATPVKEPLFC
jgi:hypothetical protein